MKDRNKWQEYYRKNYCSGRADARRYELLGKIKGDKITVHYPDFNGIRGFVPAHEETFEITFEENNMPEGKISVPCLSANLDLWESRGYRIDY